jgi:apolipoprotein D and lipocalin family protein
MAQCDRGDGCRRHRRMFDREPLRAVERPIDLDRFMGDWYVLAHIPIEIPFFSEASAYNAVESYRLTDGGIIETTYRFRDGGFDGPEVVFTPRGWVHDEQTNAEWRMQFVWPFRAAYLIAYVDDDYRNTIIGVPSRRNAWMMSRSPQVSDAERHGAACIRMGRTRPHPRSARAVRYSAHAGRASTK